MTTSEEGKKLKNVEPHWQPDGLLNIASERYAKRKETCLLYTSDAADD